MYRETQISFLRNERRKKEEYADHKMNLPIHEQFYEMEELHHE